MQRRQLIKTGVLVLPATLGACATPMAGQSASIATAFDQEMQALMAAHQFPGGALAVVKDRRLVYARGYGWADREAKSAVKADSLFRIASVSKPITSVAVMQLIEQGKLTLDTQAFVLLGLLPAVASKGEVEPRLRHITIRHLLQHSGGWDRDSSFDPMFRPREIAHATHTPAPAGPAAVIRYMLSQPLDFDPGTRFAYSNFGYCVLGRVIEKLTGQSYEKHVQSKLLAAAGIRRMRLGASLDGQQAPGEVRYYSRGQDLSANVFARQPTPVPRPYGGFHLEAMDSHGGWIASAVDLARFAAALDDPQHSALLRPATSSAMYALPPNVAGRLVGDVTQPGYYACGWRVRPTGSQGRANYWHGGSLPGTSSLLLRLANGLSMVALFNQHSDHALPDDAIDPALQRAAARVTKWPHEDLFASFA